MTSNRAGLILFIVAALSGCESLNSLGTRGAAYYDETLSKANWWICNGASVGSIRRAYDTEERAKIWRELCETRDTVNLWGPFE